MKPSAIGSTARKLLSISVKTSWNHKLCLPNPFLSHLTMVHLILKVSSFTCRAHYTEAVLILQTIPVYKSLNSQLLTPATSNCYFYIWYRVQEPFFFYPETIISSEKGKDSRFLFVIFSSILNTVFIKWYKQLQNQIRKHWQTMTPSGFFLVYNIFEGDVRELLHLRPEAVPQAGYVCFH